MSATQYQIFIRYLNDKINRIVTNKTEMQWINSEEYNILDKLFNDTTYNNKTSKYEKKTTEYYNNYIKIKEYLLIKNKAFEEDNEKYANFADKVLKISDLSVEQVEIYNNGQRYEEIQRLQSENKAVEEYCIIEPKDSMSTSSNTQLHTYMSERMKYDLDMYDIIIEESLITNPKYDMVFMYDGIAYDESIIADYHPENGKEPVQAPYMYYDKMKRIKLDPWFLYSTHASLKSAMIKAKELVNILGKDGVKIGKVIPLDQYIDIV